MSPGEILALRSRGQVGEVSPQHILFCVTLEIINPGALTAATTPFRNPSPPCMTSRPHSRCTALWEKGVSLNTFIRCAGLESPVCFLGQPPPALWAPKGPG